MTTFFLSPSFPLCTFARPFMRPARSHNGTHPPLRCGSGHPPPSCSPQARRRACAGTLLLCDGTCMRAFHGGVCEAEGGGWEAYDCNPLGCSRELFAHVQASNEPFECPNCLARVHQCSVCKVEGASDASAGAQEVFRCAGTLRAACTPVDILVTINRAQQQRFVRDS